MGIYILVADAAEEIANYVHLASMVGWLFIFIMGATITSAKKAGGGPWKIWLIVTVIALGFLVYEFIPK